MLPLFASILLNSPIFAPLVKAQEGNAYFTKIEGYPKSKIFQSSRYTWNFSARFTVYNANCTNDGSGRAWFFIKVYKNNDLWWHEYDNTTYHVWQCNKEHEAQRLFIFSIPTWQGPKVFNFRIELYWNNTDNQYFQDTISFSVNCVLFINCPFPFQSNITVLSYFAVYLLATILSFFYFLTTRPHEYWR